jgi:uncharacterized protein (DUF3084 family)
LRVEAERKKLENNLNGLKSRYRKLAQNKTNLDRTISQLEADIASGERQLVAKQAELARISSIAIDYGQALYGLGQGQLAVALGQVFAEGRLAPRMSPVEARSALHVLLARGAEASEKLGGKPHPDPENGAPSVRALHLAPLPRPGSSGDYTEDQQIENIANILSTLTTPVSVRLMAARNYAVGEEKYQARVVAVPIRRAFADGETITSMSIDGSDTDARIFRALLALVNAGEKVARGQKGVNPLLTDENPEFYAADTNERIFEALRSSQMENRRVNVRLVADGDILTVDNMRVRFVIETA